MRTRSKNTRWSAWPLLFALMIATGSAGIGASGRPEAAPPAPDSGTVTVTDDLGTEMQVPARPQRILSVSLFSDEVLLTLVDPERFAAVAPISQNPVYSNVAELASDVTPVIDFAAEQVIAARPDLVVAADWSEADIIAQVRQAGIPVYQVATPTTLDGILDAILDLGELAGEQAAVASLLEELEDRIAGIRARAARLPASERVTALDYNTWGTASGGDTTWQIVLNLAGINNAAAELDEGDFGQVPISKELVVELDPDVLFLPGYIWGEEGAAEAFEAQVVEDPAFSGLTAIATERVFLFPERLKGTYSHFILDAADYAYGLVYGER